MHACTHARIHACTRARMHARTHARAHRRANAHTHACVLYVRAWVRTCVRAYVRTSVRVDTWVAYVLALRYARMIHTDYTGMFPVGDSCRTLIAVCVSVCLSVCLSVRRHIAKLRQEWLTGSPEIMWVCWESLCHECIKFWLRTNSMFFIKIN